MPEEGWRCLVSKLEDREPLEGREDISGDSAVPEESDEQPVLAEAVDSAQPGDDQLEPEAVGSAREATEKSSGDDLSTQVSLEDSEADAPTENTTDVEIVSGPLGVPGLEWYIVHTYSGFEQKVKDSLRTRADAFGFADRIGEILIPTEDVVEMRGGKKVTSRRLLYPGYIVIQLNMDDEVWHVVKNTPRVTGFVGSNPEPVPLTANEVNQILYRQTSSKEKPRPKMSFQHNDRVKIIDGPFTNFSGTVEDVNPDRSTLRVMVTIFGRGTPVELEYFQVEKESV